MKIIETKKDWQEMVDEFWEEIGYRFPKNLQELFKFTPWSDGWDSSAGSRDEGITVIFILENGEEIEAESSGEMGYGSNHIPNQKWNAPNLGEQIAKIENEGQKIKALKVWGEYYCSWEDYGDRETNLYFIPLKPVDYKKIRRRIEDTLRKTTNKQLLIQIAEILNVKLV